MREVGEQARSRDHAAAAVRSHNWAYWASRVAVAVLVPVALLIATEGALRIAGVGTPASILRACTVNGRLAFCDNQYFTKTFFPPGVLRTAAPFAIPAEKPPGTFRIFILGESAAYGDPDPTFGFSRYLDVMLRERFPSIKFEIINAGITAINSNAILPIARDLADHQPDLFIIYAGNNEVIGPFGAGTVFTSAALSLPAIRTSIFLRSTRIGQLVQKLIPPSSKGPRRWEGMEMFLNQQVPASSPLMEHTYRNFAGNLSDIITAARNSGAKVLVSTVATNLRDCAPFASLHRAGMRPKDLRSWSDLVQQGMALEDAGSYAQALKQYLAAAEIDPDYAELQFRIARCLWALGDFAAAQERFVRAQDLDTLRFRADTRINDIIRSAASKNGSAVELVDAAQTFAKESPHGVPGRELFYEHVHLNPRGNYVLARALFARIAAMLPPGTAHPAANDSVLPEADCERLLAFTSFDRARIARDVVERLERPPFTNQLNHDEEVSNMMSQAELPAESYEQTEAEYRWAIARDPEDRLLHLNYGFFLHHRDRQAADQQFSIARPYDNPPYLCNWKRHLN